MTSSKWSHKVTIKLEIYVIEPERDRASSLRAQLMGLPTVRVLQTYAEAQDASGGLDAIFVPLMSVLEWGVITPPAPLEQTQVVKMPDYEIARGRPKYAIPGVATSPNSYLSPSETTRLILRESVKAINRFNRENAIPLQTIGVTSLRLGLDKLRPGEAIEIFTEELTCEQ